MKLQLVQLLTSICLHAAITTAYQLVYMPHSLSTQFPEFVSLVHMPHSVLNYFNLLTQCIHLLIHYNCLLLFLCVWSWLRATSLLVPLADADCEQCTTYSPTNECYQWADNSCNGYGGSSRQTFVWSRNKEWGQMNRKAEKATRSSITKITTLVIV